jgi:hypothetical protein
MPVGFITHFRYKFKYVDDQVVNNPNTFLEKEVVIFYTLQDTGENIPIRKAKIVKVEVSKETSLFHAYMELQEFTSVRLESEKEEGKFFTQQNVEFAKSSTTWADIVEKVNDSFQGMLFYNINSISSERGDLINIKQRKDKKASLYRLRHGEKYLINMSIGNPSGQDSGLNFKSSSDAVTANTPNPIQSTARYDDITVPIYIKSLNVSRDYSFISFSPTSKCGEIHSEYNSNIEVVKGIAWYRSFIFGLLTLMAFLGFAMVKDSSNSFKRIFSWHLPIDYVVLIGIFFIISSSSIFFYFFNKK